MLCVDNPPSYCAKMQRVECESWLAILFEVEVCRNSDDNRLVVLCHDYDGEKDYELRNLVVKQELISFSQAYWISTSKCLSEFE